MIVGVVLVLSLVAFGVSRALGGLTEEQQAAYDLGYQEPARWWSAGGGLMTAHDCDSMASQYVLGAFAWPYSMEAVSYYNDGCHDAVKDGAH